jgi:hypothetical protein
VIVAEATEVVGQSTISSWPIRCGRLIRLKMRRASDSAGADSVVGDAEVEDDESVIDVLCVGRGVLLCGPGGRDVLAGGCVLEVHAARTSTAPSRWSRI